ncbi:MAG: archaeosortase/exosortase family protein [Bacteroidales bacterium]|nr:archaeosortase/exosortase family protein [Bacteroidales bacterium]
MQLANLYSKYYSNQSYIIKIIINCSIMIILGLIFFCVLKNNYWIYCFYEEGVYYLTELIAYSTQFILKLFGFDCYVFGKIISDTFGCSLILDRGCLGRLVLITFCFLIIAFPAKVFHKICYTIFGIITIIILNIIRISALIIVGHYYPDTVNFFHEYIFHYALYVGVFALWVLWFKIKEKTEKKENKN